jgi:hypothetical protein
MTWPLVTTDIAATAAKVIERYASRWSIEVTIEDARQVFGAGQARNRTARVVERTVPFQLACQAIATCWYATADHDPADVADHRARAPWYASKAQPSTADMAAKLRRVINAARFKFKASRLTSRPAKKTASFAWPGKTSPHNHESREVINRVNITNAVHLRSVSAPNVSSPDGDPTDLISRLMNVT